MINFFVKAGRPSKEEKAIAERIHGILKKAEADGDATLLSAVESHGAVYNLDGLKKLLASIESKSFVNKKSENNNPNKNMSTNKDKKSAEENNPPSFTPPGDNIEDVQFEETTNLQTESPLQQPVVERKDEFENYKQEHGLGGDGEGEGDDGSSFEPPRDEGEPGGDDDDDKTGDDIGGGGSGDIPGHTKNLSNAKIAKMVGTAYVKILPLLPKKIAKISDSRIEKMERYDELSMDMRLRLPEGGETTVRNYISYYNTSLDARLVVSPDMEKDFRVALRDMLDEKKVDATPTQVFFGTVISQLALLSIDAAEQMAAMNNHLKFWKEAHEENKKAREERSGGGKSNSGNNNSNPTKKTTAEPPVKEANTAPVKTEVNNNKEEPEEDDGIQNENEELTIKPEDAQVK